MATLQETLCIDEHTGAVSAVAFNKDGTRLATQSADKVHVWDANTGHKLSEKPHDRVIGVAFSPTDGSLLASCGYDGLVKVWDWKTGKEIPGFRGHTDLVWGAAFSPDGPHLATASKDRTVKVWNVTTGQRVHDLRGHTAFSHLRVAFSPDGSRLAASGSENSIKLWDLRTGRETIPFKGHTHRPISFAFSPDGKRLTSVGWDQALRIWDAATGQEALVLNCPTPLYNVAFSPDGNRIAATGDKIVMIWDARPWTAETAVQREAISLLSCLFAKPLRRSDVVHYL